VRQAGGLPAAGVPAVDPGEACHQATAAGLVVHRADPLNAEARLAALTGTAPGPAEPFYIRNHFGIPDLDPATWRLAIGGLAGRALSLSLAELRAMPSRTAVITLECAGNGRSLLDPPVPGESWGLGAVGTAAWTGVPLTDVLNLAAPQPGAWEVVFRGADSGLAEGRHGPVPFERSLPLRYLGSAGALLAYAMNGQPLPKPHGYPLRLVVPGWYGVASVKWLTAIELTSRPFDGHFQVDRYHIGGKPLTLQAVRSVIIGPRPGDTVAPGEDVVVRGLAWSGAGPIARVEVSVAGRPWRAAVLTGTRHAHGWQEWLLRARLEEPGSVTIQARATDTAGRTQPAQPTWNPLGYATNPIHQVVVTVRGAPAELGTSTNTPHGALGDPALARRRRRHTPRNRKRSGSAWGSPEKPATAASRARRAARHRPSRPPTAGP
jgi:DMSO/TMAO reductase YedYZ molybdopterin-dependent catalytic subunit